MFEDFNEAVEGCQHCEDAKQLFLRYFHNAITLTLDHRTIILPHQLKCDNCRAIVTTPWLFEINPLVY